MSNALSSLPPSLALRAAALFPMRACLAGYQLRHEGGVAMTIESKSVVSAIVKSEKKRTVLLRSNGDRLAVSCTCAPSSGDAPTCKHVWAAFLEVDRQGALEAARIGTGKLVLEPLATVIEAAVKSPPKSAARKKPQETKPPRRRRS